MISSNTALKYGTTIPFVMCQLRSHQVAAQCIRNIIYGNQIECIDRLARFCRLPPYFPLSVLQLIIGFYARRTIQSDFYICICRPALCSSLHTALSLLFKSRLFDASIALFFPCSPPLPPQKHKMPPAKDSPMCPGPVQKLPSLRHCRALPYSYRVKCHPAICTNSGLKRNNLIRYKTRP